MTRIRFRKTLLALTLGATISSVGYAANASLPATPTNRSFANSYWGDEERGWFWYEDPMLEPDAREAPKPADKPAPTKEPRKAPELVELERLQKRLEDYRKIAIMRPTEGNVLRYMRLEAEVIRKASHFADVAQRLGWTNPELDMSLEGRPVNPLAVRAYDQQQIQDNEAAIREVSKDHAIFFFFRGDCHYCHAYAPILEQFASRFGFTVVAISLDGGAVPQFPAPRADNGISRSLGVSQVPATFLAQPFSGTITPLGFGVLSTDQLINRVAVISSPETKRELPGLAKRMTLQ